MVLPDMVIAPGPFPVAGTSESVLLYCVIDSPLCPVKALTYAANIFCWSIHASSFPIHAQEAYIHKMLLYSCHFCPTTDLIVAECPVPADATTVFSALSIGFKAGLPLQSCALSKGVQSRLKERIIKVSDNFTSSSSNLSFLDRFFPCGSLKKFF